MSSLSGQVDFAKTEEEICQKWKDEDTFQTQNRLALERHDPVRSSCRFVDHDCFVSYSFVFFE